MDFTNNSILYSSPNSSQQTSHIKKAPTLSKLSSHNIKSKTLLKNSINKKHASIKHVQFKSPQSTHPAHSKFTRKTEATHIISPRINMKPKQKSLISKRTIITTSSQKFLPVNKIILPSSQQPDVHHTQPNLKKTHTLTDHTLTSSHLSTTLQNYYGTYPSSTELLLHKFGRPSTDHSFTSDMVFDHVLIFILKTKYLSQQDTKSILQTHPLYLHLHETMKKLQHLDFRPLSSIDEKFAARTTIPFTRTRQFMAAILHYNFHVGSLIRYCGNNYTNAHIDVPTLIDKIKHIVPTNILNYVENRLTIGAPSFIRGHNTRSNFLDYYRYGNHTTIEKNQKLVAKALIKEDKYNFFLPFPSWMTRFFYHLDLSPEGLVIKPGKADRLVFDATFKIHPQSLSLNTTWTHVKDEPPIWYGSAFRRHLLRIWNLRISYPSEDILLWDDDVSGAFRLIKYNPEIATAFAAILNHTLCIPVGQNFGGNTSAQNWEGVAMARECIAQHFSNPTFKHLLTKHKQLLSLIKFSKIPTPKTIFTPATLDTINKGVVDQAGDVKNTPHNTFVDDNCIADIRCRIPQAMAASAEALFLLLGYPDVSNDGLH